MKAFRAVRNNGSPADDCVKQVLSPYPEDRSALTDAAKVLTFTGVEHRGLLAYAYAYDSRPLVELHAAFELLLSRRVRVVNRVAAEFDGLVHPHHRRGTVFGWELEPLRDPIAGPPFVNM